ncbi:MAG: adenylate/guanylate cyclase domain-containing protein [Verrucomicrobia bacterium]|nr:adenylate/guanylate cyclase domain-containing protein [Verrucomicrobiota bacterium]MBS0645630.1 adenylate/guanylate cyclase domain-containing protein [Verrucomicrobiota bacterium]
MKTLRAKLFMSVGIILLIVSCLSYLLPEIFIRREIKQGGVYINQYVQQMEQKILQTSSFVLLYRFMESGAALLGDAKRAEQVEPLPADLWKFAVEIASYNPEIAFVQLSLTDGTSIVVSPEDAELYLGHSQEFKEGKLWVKIQGKEAVFLAVPDPLGRDYLLFSQDQLKNLAKDASLDPKLAVSFLQASEFLESHPQISFAPFSTATVSPSIHSQDEFYRFLLQKQTLLENKLSLISALETWQQSFLHPAGIFRLGDQKQSGQVVLSQEAFSGQPILPLPLQPNQEPMPFLRHKKGYIEVEAVSIVERQHPSIRIAIGFSVSKIVQQIAQLIERPILITEGNNLIVGISPEGDCFNDIKMQDSKNLTWRGVDYLAFRVPLAKLNLVVLTKKSQITEIDSFLADLGKRLMQQISLNLVGVTLLSLGIALLLLGRICKKITSPIAMLACAAEDIGKGKIEAIELPKVEKRQDEVATLTHSFKKMILALRERESIRGMLNKVVSKEIAEKILSRAIELEGEERVATLLFSDIRGFTQLSQHMKPKVLIKILNAYMTRMCAIIDSTHGVVDKFVGDEIMALYGVPIDLEQHAIKAIEAAVEMMRVLKQWQTSHSESFSVGIGIHTGIVCAGNMGSENRLNYTVVGANVNLAARLCEQASAMQILVSEETWRQPGVQQAFKFRKLEALSLKGIEGLVPVYEVEF